MSEKKKWVYPEYTEVGTPENKRELSPEEAIKEQELRRLEKEMEKVREEKERKEQEFLKQQSEGFKDRLIQQQMNAEYQMLPDKVKELLKRAKDIDDELRVNLHLKMPTTTTEDRKKLEDEYRQINQEIFSGKYSIMLGVGGVEEVKHYTILTGYGVLEIIGNTIKGLEHLPGHSWKPIYSEDKKRIIGLKGMVFCALLRSDYPATIMFQYPQKNEQESIKEKPVENKEKTSKFSLSNIFKKKEEQKQETPVKGSIDYERQEIQCPKCKMKLPRASFKYSKACPNCGNPYSWE
jgi:hypothetical protein